MEIFLDTAEIEDIRKYRDFIDGVTTNPSLMSKRGGDNPLDVIREICDTIDGPISAEVLSNTYKDMLKEGKALAAVHSNVCVKLPCTVDGLKVCKALSSEGISTNLTLCFSPTQALIAAKCGATYVSPFIGRLDDIGQDGTELIENIVDIYEVNGYETKVLAASVRGVQHVVQAAILGADAITLPTKILKQCFEHPLTTAGLEKFASDWENRKN